eukprot:TRINITY_DN16552_c0_g1_i1.p2 TRINITY_DN16552_c0_g1~~TRINITY_DN16552_c0_g1_i1.p2  ORF type:complete len:111 (-),score=18.59 TRINITY_DN16552_c0_g1_i1:37-369(-)
MCTQETEKEQELKHFCGYYLAQFESSFTRNLIFQYEDYQEMLKDCSVITMSFYKNLNNLWAEYNEIFSIPKLIQLKSEKSEVMKRYVTEEQIEMARKQDIFNKINIFQKK